MPKPDFRLDRANEAGSSGLYTKLLRVLFVLERRRELPFSIYALSSSLLHGPGNDVFGAVTRGCFGK